jgi:ribonuclease D
MGTYIPTISKDDLKMFPLEIFQGPIVVVDSVELFQEALIVLNQQQVVGFDTETKPVFAKGGKNKVALLQVATENICFLFRLNILGFPLPLIDFFNNEKILKIGLSIKDDFLMLRARSTKLDPKGFIELQSYVKIFGIEDNSLQKIYAIIFNKKISKAQRLSNWEIEKLTSGQQKYAALDAWACRKIFLELSQNSSPNK